MRLRKYVIHYYWLDATRTTDVDAASVDKAVCSFFARYADQSIIPCIYQITHITQAGRRIGYLYNDTTGKFTRRELIREASSIGHAR